MTYEYLGSVCVYVKAHVFLVHSDLLQDKDDLSISHCCNGSSLMAVVCLCACLFWFSNLLFTNVFHVLRTVTSAEGCNKYLGNE